MKLRSYFRAAFGTTLNIILYALTLGRFLWLEGRVSGGVFHNWDHNFRYRPRKFARPRTEEELVELVRSSSGLRLYGSAHSFNDAWWPTTRSSRSTTTPASSGSTASGCR